MPPLPRRCQQLLAVAVVLMLAACRSTQPLACGPSHPIHPPANFGAVPSADGKTTPIYRGGQPKTCGELEYLRGLGVKSILKLNDRQSALDADEVRRASELGMTVRSFAFDAKTIGTAATCTDVRAALAFLSDERNWPVYVHCTAGKDRTGYIVGLFERAILGEPTEAILAELHRYGHTGTRAVVFGQIDAELAKSRPECAP